MQYGDDVVLSDSGIGISAKQLAPIGVGHDTTCWGIWIADWHSLAAQSDAENHIRRPDHLVVSPLHPETWPCLLEVTLRLEDRVGSLNDAFSVMADADLEVLSHHVTPTGHHHATLCAIATIPEILNSSEVYSWRRRTQENRDVNTAANSEQATHDIAMPILDRIISIKEQMLKSNRGMVKPFLRSRFIEPRDMVYNEAPRGLAFDPDYLPFGEIRELGYRQLVEAIEIRWLQFPAFFWLYCVPEPVIQLRYNQKNERLTVEPPSRVAYSEGRQRVYAQAKLAQENSIRAIMSIDTAARYVRIMPNRPDDGTPYRLQVRHCVKNSQSVHDEDRLSTVGGSRRPNTRGLLHAVTSELRRRHANLWHASSQLMHMGDGVEDGVINFWLTQDRAGLRAEGQAQDEKKWVDRLATSMSSIDLPSTIPSGTTITTNQPQRMRPDRVFVSTKAGWYEDQSNPVRQSLEKEMTRLGLTSSLSIDVLTGRIDDYPRNDATEKLHSVDGFIQILPRFLLAKKRTLVDKIRCRCPGGMEWLAYELGIGMARSLPMVFLCEGTSDDLLKWQIVYKGLIHTNYLYAFDSTDSQVNLDRAIKGAVEFLDAKLRERYQVIDDTSN